MEFKLSLFNNALIQKQAVSEIIKCNDVTSRFGLALTENQAKALVQTRTTALNENGRIEFGSGIINKIIYEFCDSPFISERNYEKTLHELIEIFYYYKNETLDLISDEDLIKYMKKAFDGVSKGSLELLSGRELYNLAHNLRCGYPIDYTDNPNNDDKEDEDEEY